MLTFSTARKKAGRIHLLIFLFLWVFSCRQPQAFFHTHLALVNQGTENVYFTYGDQPLLSFGPGPGDVMFWLNEDAKDYRLWADWAAKHGMS